MGSFVTLSDLLKIDADYLKSNAIKSAQKYNKFNEMYKKNKDPSMKKMLKEYKHIVSMNLNEFEEAKQIAEESSRELHNMRKEAIKNLKTAEKYVKK